MEAFTIFFIGVAVVAYLLTGTFVYSNVISVFDDNYLWIFFWPLFLLRIVLIIGLTLIGKEHNKDTRGANWK